MDCAQFTSEIFSFSEGILPEELHRSAEHHLASCSSCARLLSEFNGLKTIIDQEKAAEPNPYAATHILQRIENEFERPKYPHSQVWVRALQPIAIAFALLIGILIGSYTANKDNAPADQLVNTTKNIEFLKSNLFIAEFADEDKILVLNK